MTQEWVINKKTNSIGLVVSRYNDLRTGKAKVEVAVAGIMAKSERAYWLASSTTDHHG